MGSSPSGPFVLRQVGAALLEAEDFPAHLSTVEQVLRALDTIHQDHHTGDAGSYLVRGVEDGGVEVVSATPCPRPFVRGLVEGVARHPRLTGGRRYGVHYAEGTPGAAGTCTLVVRPLPASVLHPPHVRAAPPRGPR